MTPPYTQESEYEQAMNQAVSQFWQSREHGKQPSYDGTLLYWCRFTSPQHTKALLILNGRVETVSKYQELFYDLFRLGYNIYSYDHRGQGLSGHLVTGSDIGHVEHFDDYVADLHHMCDFFAFSAGPPCYLLAHSMGGAIGMRYLQQHPDHPFKAFANSAPMLGLPVPAHLKPIAIPYTYWLSKKSRGPDYAPGYGPYLAKPFENNPLSHCEVRYQWFRQLYKQQPELQTGGPSANWVCQSLLAVKRIYRDAAKITLPLLILQAGNDQIVDNNAAIRFIHRVKKHNRNAVLMPVAKANHELLFEQDAYRNEALDAISEFFAQN